MLFPLQANQWRGRPSFFSAGNGKKNYHAIDLFEGDPDKGSTTTYVTYKLTHGVQLLIMQK